MRGRILITGDKHGTYRPFFGLRERQELFESDILLITGDASYVWDENYPCSLETLRQLFPGTVAFLDGNHENHALLNSLPEETWQGGRVHRAGEGIYHLIRGEIYRIHGQTIFVFGGARSVDRDQRQEGKDWWQMEEPTAEELDYGRRQLLAHREEIRYVLTHETPLSARASITRKKAIAEDYRLPGVLEEWYRIMEDAPEFRQWYFGHLHVDQRITEKLRGIHNDVLLLGEETGLRWV